MRRLTNKECSISKAPCDIKTQRTVIETVHAGHLFLSTNIIFEHNAFVPHWHAFKNSVPVEIWPLLPQPFTNSHFHFRWAIWNCYLSILQITSLPPLVLCYCHHECAFDYFKTLHANFRDAVLSVHRLHTVMVKSMCSSKGEKCVCLTQTPNHTTNFPLAFIWHINLSPE